jgi:hypothetical protein
LIMAFVSRTNAGEKMRGFYSKQKREGIALPSLKTPPLVKALKLKTSSQSHGEWQMETSR